MNSLKKLNILKNKYNLWMINIGYSKTISFKQVRKLINLLLKFNPPIKTFKI